MSMYDQEPVDRSLAVCFPDVHHEESLWGAIDIQIKEQLKRLMRVCMDREVAAYLCSGWYERQWRRRGYRNGSYRRTLETKHGTVEVSVPRVRAGRCRFRFFDAYQRRAADVETLMRDLYVAGVSQRRLGELMNDLTGTRVSAQTVSQTLRSLNAAVDAFHRRPLADQYRWLFLDGVVLKSRGASGGRERVALTAYGITWGGRRELIDFMVAASESARQWEGFLNNLYHRGLHGARTELLISDGGAGLHQALAVVYPRVQHQRCWVHKVRNVCGYIPYRDRKLVCKGLRRVYRAGTRAQAIRRFWEWAQEWRKRYPKAVACVRKDLDDLLAFYRVARRYRQHVRGTNAIERCFREVRRRTRTIGCFPNDESLDRVLFAVFNVLNQSWGRLPVFEFTQNS